MLSKKELEDLRPWVTDNVTRVLGFTESTVVDAAIDCIARSLSRQAATEQLSPFLENATSSFVGNLYSKVLEIKSSKLTSSFHPASASPRKRNIEDVFGEDEPSDDLQPGQKKKRTSRFDIKNIAPESPSSLSTGPPPITTPGPPGQSSDLQELMQATMRQIEERKKQTQALLANQKIPPAGILPTPAMVPTHPLLLQGIAPSPEVNDAMEKARKAAELQARIQSQLLNKPGLLSSVNKLAAQSKASGPSKPTPLILDEEGRTIDSTGRSVQLTFKQPTIMANIRAQQRASFRQITDKKPGAKQEAEEPTVYLDPRMSVPTSQRTRKQFKFNEPGKFIKQGQMLRAKTQLEQLQSEIASVARRTGISSATKLALIAPSKEMFDDSIPAVEWWDGLLLPNKTYLDCDNTAVPISERYKDITNLIEHPVAIQPPGEPTKTAALPIMLTSKERKKLRRQRRREAEKEKQEKIQFGLMDKPEPKVRISNLMRVLGSEAIQDPTKVEAHVRAQMAERQKKHEEANAARKLTPDQRKAKKLRKLKEDLSCGVHVTVFRVHDISNPALKFKVDMNAQQYHLTGCMMLYQDVNLVIVEGGPKCLKKFKWLMTHRIKWKPKKSKHQADDDDEDSDTEAPKQNICYVVWEGKVNDRAFNDWKVRHFSTEGLARDHLKRHGVEHYWDLALSEAIVEGEED